tara:strand:+ start:459 stop:644 length:186 start_codon:yes stop_codon:yes gene_type:complete
LIKSKLIFKELCIGTIKKKVLAHIKTTKTVGAKNELLFNRYKLEINSIIINGPTIKNIFFV